MVGNLAGDELRKPAWVEMRAQRTDDRTGKMAVRGSNWNDKKPEKALRGKKWKERPQPEMIV